MNIAILCGRLVADPEVRYTNNKKATCRFKVAVNRISEGADFIQCIAWEKTAENLGKYVKKGDRILVSGSITTGSYEKDGKKVYTTDVTARAIQFLDMHKQDGGFKPADDEIPVEFTQADLDEGLPF